MRVLPATAVESSPFEVRAFGRFELLDLLGCSRRTMTWRVRDLRSGQELLLVMPRRPPGAAALERRLRALRAGARLEHPHIAHAVDAGAHDGWPYAVYDAAGCTALDARWRARAPGAGEAAQLCVQALRGLTCAHGAGLAHRDLQPGLMLVGPSGVLRIAGLEVAGDTAAASVVGVLDVTAVALVLRQALCGPSAQAEPDVALAAERLILASAGQLPAAAGLPQAVPAALRDVVERATGVDPLRRYHHARTLLGALEGWLAGDSARAGSPLARLLERLRVAGALPSLPGLAECAARLVAMDGARTEELAGVVLDDPALSFELLRMASTAAARAAPPGEHAGVLTARRAISILGLAGVAHAAAGLRPWPGGLAEPAAAELARLLARVKRAARLAVALRPTGYDAEQVWLVALLQNLGRLMVACHFPDEAARIRRLLAAHAGRPGGDAHGPAASEESAWHAVLGVGADALGLAVARLWGLGDSALPVISRLPLSTPVRAVESEAAVVRALGSCANEMVDALEMAGATESQVVERAALRYGRALGVDGRQIRQALAGRAVAGREPLLEPDTVSTKDGAPAGDPSRETPRAPRTAGG